MARGQAFAHIPGHDPKGRHWQGYDWSEWYRLRDVAEGMDDFGDDPSPINVAGLYRLSLRGQKGLLYIGQTGRSLRRRLRGHLQSAEFAVGLRHRLSTRQVRPMYRELGKMLLSGRGVLVSWTPLRISKGDRLGIEAELIAAYRAIMGKNPQLQFLSISEDEDLGYDDEDTGATK